MVNTLSIGQRLSKARHELNKKRSTIAEELNIRETYLEAIENDDYAAIPGKVYVSGFVKSYSDYLGLDTAEVLKMLKATQDLQEDYHNMPQQLYKDYKRTKNIFFLSFIGLLFTIIGFSYYNYVSHQIQVRKIEDKASSTETLTAFFNQTQNKEQTLEVEIPTEAVEPAKEEKIELYGQKSKPPFARVLFKATQDVWIQVRPLHKKRIYVSKTIPAGKYYWLSPWEGVVLDVSNAANLEVIIDDKNMGKLGSNSKKIRGLFLDVKSLNTYYEHKEYMNNEPIENYYKKPTEKIVEKTVKQAE